MAEVITFLEMTSPEQLHAGRPAPAPLQLEEVDRSAAPALRETYVRIGAPLGWIGRSSWSNAQWEDELSRPGVRAWIVRVRREVAGLLELESGPGGYTGIIIFGLVPEFVGRGFGGAFLTAAVELAWGNTSPDGSATKSVSVQTSSRDHQHAIPNYEARGFRVSRREHRPLPTGTT
jgi:GNAT superfamily N-acetyltransferase